MKKFDKKEVVKNLNRKIYSNLRIKLTCLGLAIATYFAISLFVQRSTKTYLCKLDIKNLKDYLVISSNVPKDVKVIASDKHEVFDKITENDFKVRLDLSKVQFPNRYSVKLQWDIPSSMNSFFSYIKVEPSEIDVNIEEIAEKNVTVIVNDIGQPASGYYKKRRAANPPTIRIQGPKSVINRIENIRTETVNIEGVKESFSRQVNLLSDNSMIKTFGKVDVFFEIVEETQEVEYTFRRVYFQNLKSQFKARINRSVTVKLKGAKNKIINLLQGDISLVIDCANVAYPGEYTNDILVKKPDYVEVVSIVPEQIDIIVDDSSAFD